MFPNLDCEYKWAGDEHGILHFKDTSHRPELATVVEMVVSHCDPTINLHNKFFVCDNDIVVDVWPIEAQGCCQ